LAERRKEIPLPKINNG